MKNYVVTFLIFGLNGLPLLAQSETVDDSSFPLSDYWPVLLLPIFGIVWYRWWKARKRH